MCQPPPCDAPRTASLGRAPTRLLLAAWLLAVGLLPGGRVSGAEPAAKPAPAEKDRPDTDAARWLTPAAEKAAARGLDYLVSKQQPDGTFGGGGFRGNVAVVGLCGLAMIAGGSTPGRGPHGPNVALALDYILANCQESGFINPAGFAYQGQMYGHGFATLFLAECCGMTPRPDAREKLAKAVKLTVNTQNDAGGWRYQPEKMPADISVSMSQVMALRAARNAGIFVPKETIERALSYIKKSQNRDGGFRYMLIGPEQSAFPRSAAGVAGLYSLGVYEGPELTKGLDYLMQFAPQPGVVRRDMGWDYYGHYYAAMAMWQAGGERWAKWYPAVRDDLVLKQQPSGAWDDPAVSPEFGTAAACIVLQVPNNYLPIFQR